MKSWNEFKRDKIEEGKKIKEQEKTYIDNQVIEWEAGCKGYESVVTKWQLFLYVFIITGIVILLYLILKYSEIKKINNIAFQRRITGFLILIIIIIIASFIWFVISRIKNCIKDKTKIDKLINELEIIDN